MPGEKLDQFYLLFPTVQQIFSFVIRVDTNQGIAVILDMQISIRQIAPQDAAAVTSLAHQLGYPLPVEQILQNINSILAANDHDVYVAINDNQVVGWIG